MFEDDVANHEMTIAERDPVNRQLKFKTKDSMTYSFEITTWSNHLCISGDMGTYVFKRSHDMFKFFRGPINEFYWAEKVISNDIYSPAMAYSNEAFIDLVNERLAEHIACRDEEDHKYDDELIESVNAEIISIDQRDDIEARETAVNFTFRGKRIFHDFCESILDRPTRRFSWCCKAISWAIDKYDRREIITPDMLALKPDHLDIENSNPQSSEGTLHAEA